MTMTTAAKNALHDLEERRGEERRETSRNGAGPDWRRKDGEEKKTNGKRDIDEAESGMEKRRCCGRRKERKGAKSEPRRREGGRPLPSHYTATYFLIAAERGVRTNQVTYLLHF